MESFRNTISHGRTLLLYQEKLIEGITGELKTLLINYHNKNMNPDDYFIKILKVHDNIGNIFEADSGRFGMITKSVLRVGDLIEININAYDPKGREMVYKLYNSKFQFENKTGRFQIEITEKMIGNPTVLSAIVKTQLANYENSDQVTIHYRILPNT